MQSVPVFVPGLMACGQVLLINSFRPKVIFANCFDQQADLLGNLVWVIFRRKMEAPVDPVQGRVQVIGETFPVSDFLKLVVYAPGDARRDLKLRQCCSDRQRIVHVQSLDLPNQAGNTAMTRIGLPVQIKRLLR